MVIVKTDGECCGPYCKWIYFNEWGVDCVMFPSKNSKGLGWAKEKYLRTEECLERFPK